MKKTLGLAIVLALCGCGETKNQYQFSQELDRQVQQIAELRSQYARQMSDSSFDLIRDRISLSGSYPRLGSPCAGAATETYPTEAEKAALRRWAAARSAFIAKLAVLAAPPPDATVRMARFMTEFDKANFEKAGEISAKIDELSQGGLTYCQFARAANAINRQAHRENAGYRNAIDEEIILDWKLKYGMPPVKMVYQSGQE
jgi:hypothetical protein